MKTAATIPGPRGRATPARPARATILRAVLHGAITLALAAACSEAPEARITAASAAAAPSTHAHDARGGPTADQLRAIALVRDATARFHDIELAKAAGYTTQYPAGCAASPAGAQGIHYLDATRVDEKVELLRPELVMYEPKPDGSMQLVGVDYVVPLTASAEPPTLLGVPFMRNEALGVWALHIWAWRPNPSGMFAMWNPKVSCADAR